MHRKCKATPEKFNTVSREFMRKILIGKSVLGWVSHTAGLSNREYGKILYGSDDPEKVSLNNSASHSSFDC